MRVVRYVVVSVLLIGATIYLVRAFDARRMPDLQPWHTIELEHEYRAERDDPDMSFDEYRALEDALFAELGRKIYSHVESSPENAFNRYYPGSAHHPENFDVNWNRSYELRVRKPRGGLLLVHGLTDAPYSLRRAAELFRDQGFYVLGIRLPGHGTAPASLAEATRHDWMAVVRLGARHVRAEIPDDAPLLLGGYSNGGALVLAYTLEALADETLPSPDRLYLLSPAIAVSRVAIFATWHKLLSWMPYFEKFRWTSIDVEFDPFKFNSFPKSAGDQTFQLTKTLQSDIQALEKRGGIQELPPVLTFQSVVDSTVIARAVVDQLYAKLPKNGSELVLFDINRASELRPFIRSGPDALLAKLRDSGPLRYRLTLVTNAGLGSLSVVSRTREPGSLEFEQRALGLAWPTGVYSLSHVAVPFPPEDPVYGAADQAGTLDLGNMQPRGERGLLRVPLSQLMRLRFNPFFPYLEMRLLRTLAPADSTF